MPKCWKHGDDFNGCTWSSQTLYMSMYNDIELSSGHHYLDLKVNICIYGIWSHVDEFKGNFEL